MFTLLPSHQISEGANVQKVTVPSDCFALLYRVNDTDSTRVGHITRSRPALVTAAAASLSWPCGWGIDFTVLRMGGDICMAVESESAGLYYLSHLLVRLI